MARSPQQPDRDPPTSFGANAGSAGDSTPDVDPATIAEASVSAGAGAGPTENPPEASASASTDQGITAMLYDRRVTALWSINETRNAWAHIDGLGWKRVANNSDSAFLALGLLMAHARQTNARVDFDDANGQIAQAYVW